MHGWRSLLIVLVALSVCCRTRQRFEDTAAGRGRALYTANCALCHGNIAAAGRAPELFHSIALSRDKNGSVVGPIIRAGRPALGMPSFNNLTSAQISDLATYLHYEHAMTSAGATGGELLRSGNAAEGKAYFAANCSGCHSVTGDLAGIASR